MTLDVIAVILLGILSYLGWRTGALGQVLRIVAALMVLFFGRIAARLVRETLFGTTEIAAPIVEVTSFFLGGTLLYGSVVLVGWFVIRTMRAATPTLATMDRAGGAALGAVKASVLIYVLLAGALLLGAGLKAEDPDDRLHLRNGYLTAAAQEYDVFSPWRIDELESLHRLLRVGMEAKEKGVEHALREHEKVADLLRRQSIRELVDDEKLQPAVEAGRSAQTLADERIRALLNDERFMELLEQIDFDELEAVIDTAGSPAAEEEPKPTEPPPARPEP